jgi:hypothetical protein
MPNTSYIINTFRDANPYSATYNTTKEERVYDPITCPNNSPIWVEQSRTCTKKTYSPSGALGNDGKASVTFIDTNPDSPTYNTTKTEVLSDLTNCPLPNTNPDWELQSSTCEID